MNEVALSFRVLPETLAVIRLDPGTPVPQPAGKAAFWSCTLTGEELSVVCEHRAVGALRVEGGNSPTGVRVERGFRAIKVTGPLDFALTGVLSRLLAPLAEAGVPVLAISTFDTDYLLVREGDLSGAVEALRSVAALEP